MKIETILTPAELPALAQRDLRQTACVVFDVLRATSTFVTALHHGARAIIPVSEIAEALEIKKAESRKQKAETILLGGERNGVRISAGGIDFDLGNSPCELICRQNQIWPERSAVRKTRSGCWRFPNCATTWHSACSWTPVRSSPEWMRMAKSTASVEARKNLR